MRLALLALLLAALLASACGEDDPSDAEIVVVPPELGAGQPAQGEQRWRDSVLEICAETQRRVGEASVTLAREFEADPDSRDEGELSRLIFERTRPIIEEQLSELARLAPPDRLREGYEELIAQLALDLELTGRIAVAIDAEGGDADVTGLAEQLASVGDRARKLIRRLGIEDCVPGQSQGVFAD